MSVARFQQPRLNRVKLIPCKVFEAIERNVNDEPKRRNFRFDLNALADFEQEVGMGFSQLMTMKAGFAMVRALYFCGLKHEDRTLTIEYIGDMIGAVMKLDENPLTVDDLMEVAFQALSDQKAIGGAQKQLAEGDDEKKNPPTPAEMVAAGRVIDIRPTTAESGPGPSGSDESSSQPTKSESTPGMTSSD